MCVHCAWVTIRLPSAGVLWGESFYRLQPNPVSARMCFTPKTGIQREQQVLLFGEGGSEAEEDEFMASGAHTNPWPNKIWIFGLKNRLPSMETVDRNPED